MPEQRCGDRQPHGPHEYLEDNALRRECPGIPLKITEARLTLLRAVADGLVHGDAAGDTWLDERLAGFYDPMTAGRWKVTAPARRQADAGWITRGPDRKYRLTAVGRDLLARDSGSSASEGENRE